MGLCFSFCGRSGLNGDVVATSFGFEHYSAANESIQSVVTTHAYISTWVVDSATLTLDDITCFSKLSAKNFNAE